MDYDFIVAVEEQLLSSLVGAPEPEVSLSFCDDDLLFLITGVLARL
jgi:hypothetical protein